MCKKNRQEITLEFSESNEWAGEGDTSDEGSQEEECLDHISSGVSGKVGLLQDVVSKAGKDRSGSHQTVEEGHHLGQVSDLHILTPHHTNQTTCQRVKKKNENQGVMSDYSLQEETNGPQQFL